MDVYLPTLFACNVLTIRLQLWSLSVVVVVALLLLLLAESIWMYGRRWLV